MRKYFIVMTSVLLALSLSAQRYVNLENKNMKAVFDVSNGSLVHLENKQTRWKVISREQLGQSFEILVPLKEKRFHVVKGVEQTKPEVNASPEKIVFTWKSLQSDFVEGNLDITFEGTVALTDEGLEYGGALKNNSSYEIEYVSWPYFGEVSVPDKKQRFVFEHRSDTRELFPMFFNEQGYWGVDYPTQICMLPENSLLLIRNDEQGIYVGSKQAVPSEMLIGSFELIPGYEIQNPLTDEMDGEMVRIQFKANHVVYTKANNSAALVPVQVQLYKGSWHKGADIYKEWKNTLATGTSPDWMKQPASWQKVNISQASDLVNYAKGAKEQGVQVLWVNGWMRNGENEVGTIDNLANAIGECQRLGVKVVLDVNLTNVDAHSEWYRDELKNYLITDPFGVPYSRTTVCPMTQQVKDMVEKQLAQNPAIQAADGVFCNDNNHRNKTFYCFSKDHGHKTPELTATGYFEMEQYLADQAKKSNKEYAVLGYGLFDTQSTSNGGYRIPSVNTSSMQRYLNTDLPLIASVDVRTARQDMNMCLKNRYNICYDLQFYNNKLAAYPHIMTYGNQIETLRKKYADFIWNGEFTDTQGATVSGADLSYAVYKRKSDGKKAVVIVNRSENKASTAKVSVDGRALVMASPEKQEAVAFSGNVEIQPQSVVVVMEK